MVEMLGIFFIYFILFATAASKTTFQSLSRKNIKNFINPRIHGGLQADAGQFPYHVSLRQIDVSPLGVIRTKIYCGATLISDRWVITAAHCITGKHENATDRVLVIGSFHYDSDGVWYGIEKKIPHPKFNVYESDIGLIKTSRVVYESEYIKPIPLGRDEVKVGEMALMAGFGVDETGFSPLFLNYVSVRVINNAECIKSHTTPYVNYVYSTTICTIVGKKVGACTGDSGGSLVQNGKLVGVISWGVPCALGLPDQHSRISSYLNWIEKHTGITAV